MAREEKNQKKKKKENDVTFFRWFPSINSHSTRQFLNPFHKLLGLFRYQRPFVLLLSITPRFKIMSN